MRPGDSPNAAGTESPICSTVARMIVLLLSAIEDLGGTISSIQTSGLSALQQSQDTAGSDCSGRCRTSSTNE